MSRHVLIVDDVQTNRMLPGMILRGLGDVIYECAGGEEALAMLAQAPITHVLLDISLPKVSGVDICRRIRERPEWRHIRLIAYTAHAQAHEVKAFLEAGFDAVLTKPIQAQDILSLVGGDLNDPDADASGAAHSAEPRPRPPV